MAHRFFAWLYPKILGPHEAQLVDRKRALFAEVRGTVLEIGPGTGANLSLLPEPVHWIGIEPNPYMHPMIRAEAAKLGRDIDLRSGSVEHLDVPDASIDAVIATLVFCSVANPGRGVQEIRRVLKPGGRFLFVEHVGAPAGTWPRRIQRWVRPGWSLLADGCQPDRDTGRLITEAGFRSVQIDPFKLPFPIIGPHILGVAWK